MSGTHAGPVHVADLARLGLEAGQQPEGSAAAVPAAPGSAVADKQQLTPPSDDDGTSTVYYHSAASSLGGRMRDGPDSTSAHHRAKAGKVVAPLSKIDNDSSNDNSDNDSAKRDAGLPREASSSSEAPSIGKGSEQRPSSESQQASERDFDAARKEMNATKLDYFSRHPDPDVHLRHGGQQSASQKPTAGSSSRNRNRRQSNASRSRGTGKGNSSRETSSQSEGEGGNRSSADAGGGLFSPALSTGTTLSAGVSLGATMGGSERIFPIRSVVKSATSKQSVTGRDGSQHMYSPTSDSAGSTSARGLYDGYFPAPSTSSGSDRPGKAGSIAEADDEEEQATYDHHTYGHEYSRRSPIPDDTSDFSFPRTRPPPAKPDYARQDSDNSNRDSANSGPTTIGAPSYPTTSQHSSDDSDPTARRNSSTVYTPTTAPSRKALSETSRRHSSLPPIDSDNDDPDIIKLAKDAYDHGDAEEGPSTNSGHLGSITQDKDGLYLTVRFEHQETDEGHTILTGRKGELLKCEDEPIHIPGAVQDYGVLLAVEEDENGKFVVVQVSEVSLLPTRASRHTSHTVSELRSTTWSPSETSLCVGMLH